MWEKFLFTAKVDLTDLLSNKLFTAEANENANYEIIDLENADFNTLVGSENVENFEKFTFENKKVIKLQNNTNMNTQKSKQIVIKEIESNENQIVVKFEKVFYTNKEMMKMLDCTEKTLRRYRNDGYIGYSRVGDKFYYTAEDIYMFLKNSHIDSYQYS